jgi:hypothetical protein
MCQDTCGIKKIQYQLITTVTQQAENSFKWSIKTLSNFQLLQEDRDGEQLL